MPEDSLVLKGQEDLVNDLVDRLYQSRNLILTGAPGTGKTTLARLIARKIVPKEELTADDSQYIGFVQFHPSYDYTDFVEGLRPCTFSGKSSESGEPSAPQIGFQRIDGIFKDFCRKAENGLQSKEKIRNYIVKNRGKGKKTLGSTEVRFKITSASGNDITIEHDQEGPHTISIDKFAHLCGLNPKDLSTFASELGLDGNKRKIASAWAALAKEYVETNIIPAVFIIDEINRGNLSKIFGELFFAIDPDYRGEEGKKYHIQTQYQNLVEEDDIFKDGFYVPQNVYIIGTMNDIDRSVDSMDFAFRRRFSFVEISAEDTQYMLDKLESHKDEARKRMNNLNEAIRDTYGLGKAYEIGASYFLKINEFDDEKDDVFKSLWDYYLRGVLYEYLRGEDNIDDTMKKFEEAYSYSS